MVRVTEVWTVTLQREVYVPVCAVYDSARELLEPAS